MSLVLRKLPLYEFFFSFMNILLTFLSIVHEFTDLMQYHYIKGTYYSAGLTDGEHIPTVQGTDVVIHTNKSNYLILSICMQISPHVASLKTSKILV